MVDVLTTGILRGNESKNNGGYCSARSRTGMACEVTRPLAWQGLSHRRKGKINTTCAAMFQAKLNKRDKRLESHHLTSYSTLIRLLQIVSPKRSWRLGDYFEVHAIHCQLIPPPFHHYQTERLIAAFSTLSRVSATIAILLDALKILTNLKSS